LNEIAEGMPTLTFSGRAKALLDAKENMAILRLIVQSLGLGEVAAGFDATGDLAKVAISKEIAAKDHAR
jgi:hypothetical protein